MSAPSPYPNSLEPGVGTRHYLDPGAHLLGNSAHSCHGCCAQREAEERAIVEAGRPAKALKRGKLIWVAAFGIVFNKV